MMPGEFTIACDVCHRDFDVVAPPRCPECGFDCMLCDDHMGTHDCDEAKADYLARLGQS